MKAVALIVAGGSGSRVAHKNSIPKQYYKVMGKEILCHTIERFLKHPMIDGIKIVIRPQDKELYLQAAKDLDLLPCSYGGITRQQSVYNGLNDLSDYNPEFVLIHDAARPMVNRSIISNIIEKLLSSFKAVDTGIPVNDTIKNNDGSVLKRDELYLTQTPQGFAYDKIKFLHEKYKNENFTDDISLCLKDALEIATVEGDKQNFKITTAQDLEYAKYLMEKEMTQQKTTLIGMGFDVHTFSEQEQDDTTIPICGVLIPHNKSIIAHSDGDVGIHALVDAILGALADGDIGIHFPPTDPKYKDMPSSVFLEHTKDLLDKRKARVNNVDITIICERPKIAQHKDNMRMIIANILDIPVQRVSVKATTTEKMGFLGRKEGIAAQAVCAIEV